MQKREFLLFTNKVRILLNRVGGGASASDLDVYRRAHGGLGKVQDVAWHGCREQECLTLGWNGLNDLRELRLKAHIQHAVRLIQDEGRDTAEGNGALLQVIDQASWSSDDDLRLVANFTNLTIHRRASNKKCRTKLNQGSNFHEGLLNLQSEFTRRSENQHGATFFGEVLQDREAESEGFSGTGLSDTKNIFAFKNHRNGLRLNRGWGSVVQAFENIDEFWS